MTEKPLLTIPESAALLRLPVAGLRRWVQLGRLIPVRDRKGGIFFRRGDLLAARERWEHAETQPRPDASLG